MPAQEFYTKASLIVAAAQAVITIVTTMFIYKLSARTGLMNTSLPVVTTLFHEWRESIGPKNWAAFQKWDVAVGRGAKQNELDEIMSEEFRHVRNYFDNIGLLIYIGAVDKFIVIDFLGDSAAHLWQIASAFTHQERKRRAANGGDEYYHLHFEYFAELTQTNEHKLRLRELHDRINKLKTKRKP